MSLIPPKPECPPNIIFKETELFEECPVPSVTEIQRLQTELGQWQDETFGKAGPEGCLAHLKKEIKELIDDPNDRMEYADCFMLLIGAYKRSGGTADDLVNAGFEKLAINRLREWGEPDENGVVEHVRTQTRAEAAASKVLHDPKRSKRAMVARNESLTGKK